MSRRLLGGGKWNLRWNISSRAASLPCRTCLVCGHLLAASMRAGRTRGPHAGRSCALHRHVGASLALLGEGHLRPLLTRLTLRYHGKRLSACVQLEGALGGLLDHIYP